MRCKVCKNRQGYSLVKDKIGPLVLISTKAHKL